jgi:hypothetical protein
VDEQASFEARAVLAPRRGRAARLALLVPVVAFVAIAWAGLSGPSGDSTAALSPRPTAISGASNPVASSLPVVPALPVEPAYPAEVIGLAVHRLGELQIGSLGRDDVVAIAGWYVATGITDCPRLPAIYRDGALPYFRGDADKLAFCVRSGTLYPSRPDLGKVAPAGVAVTVVVGVIMPLELEAIGNDPTKVVVLGRFAKFSDGCRLGVGCSRELLLDHVAWTPRA